MIAPDKRINLEEAKNKLIIISKKKIE